MGSGFGDHCCRGHPCHYRLMQKHLSLILCVVCFSACVCNKLLHFTCRDPYIDSFLSCYFNDLIGSIGFAAFSDFLLRLCGKELNKYRQILILMLFCSVVWEIITPIFRSSTVGDIFDMVAYVLGGSIYYGISVLCRHCRKNKNKPNKGGLT